MKKLVVVLLLSGCAWGVAYNTRASGDWSNVNTWTTGACGGAAAVAVPGDGDTANICTGHAVAVTTSVIVGTSGATGTVALTRAGTGSLTINSGGTLSLRGDYSTDRDAAPFTVNAGGTLQFDPPVGSTYKVIQTNVGTGYPNAVCTGTNTPGVRDAVITTTARGGGNGWWDGSTNGRSFGLNFHNCKITNLGGPAQIAYNATAINHTNGQNIILSDVLWQADELHLVVNADDGAGHTVSFDKVDFRALASSTANTLTYSSDNAIGTDTRSFTNVTAYNGSGSLKTITITTQGATFGAQSGAAGTACTTPGLYVYDVNLAFGSASANAGNLKCSFINQDLTQQEFSINGNVGTSVNDNVFYTNYANAHHIFVTTARAVGANTYQFNVCDGSNNTSSDVGDFVIENNAGTVKNNILITSCGVVATMNNASTASTQLNNTTANSSASAAGAYSYGPTVGETTGAAGQLVGHRNNLYYNVRIGLHEDAGTNFVRQTAAGDWIDNNLAYRMGGSADPSSPAAPSGAVTLNYPHPTLTGNPVMYIQYPQSGIATLTAVTTTAGTNTTTVVCSTCNYTTAGLQVGDFWFNSARSQTPSRVTVVGSATSATISPAITGQVSGDTGAFKKSWWTSTTALYGDANLGANDLHADPQFHDNTCSLASWATLYGFTATPQGVGQKLALLNGWDSTGVAGSYDSRASVSNALNYIRSCYMPQNKALIKAGAAGDGTPDIGAVSVGQIRHKTL